jgi:hypothetical protein
MLAQSVFARMLMHSCNAVENKAHLLLSLQLRQRLQCHLRLILLRHCDSLLAAQLLVKLLQLVQRGMQASLLHCKLFPADGRGPLVRRPAFQRSQLTYCF